MNVLLVALGVILVFYNAVFIVKEWYGSSHAPYVTIQGKKPEDARVSAWVEYVISGEDCEAYSVDLFGKKVSKGGVYDLNVNQDHANASNRYKLHINLAQNEVGKCSVELRSIKVQAYNEFDPNGFAGLELFSSGVGKRPAGSLVANAVCNEDIWQANNGKWLGSLACDYEVDGGIDTAKGNYLTVKSDFSSLSESSVIKYNIVAGKHYRLNELDPDNGP